MRVFIVDDRKLTIGAWKNLLSDIENIEIVGVTMESDEALNGIKFYRPEIVLLDLNLKDTPGIDFCEKIISESPKIKVIAVSVYNKIAIVKRIISKGAKGYLTKNVETDELVTAIVKVYRGDIYICEEIKSKLIQEFIFSPEIIRDSSKQLTVKEIQIVEQVAKGLTSREISEELFLSKRTIETHRYNILKKLGLPNSAKLISWAIQNGYLNN